jgi:hypothetical protein
MLAALEQTLSGFACLFVVRAELGRSVARRSLPLDLIFLKL